MNEEPGTYEEWRVTGEPGGRFSPYERVWSQRTRPDLDDPAAAARNFIANINFNVRCGPWDDGPHLSHRTVTISEWRP